MSKDAIGSEESQISTNLCATIPITTTGNQPDNSPQSPPLGKNVQTANVHISTAEETGNTVYVISPPNILSPTPVKPSPSTATVQAEITENQTIALNNALVIRINFTAIAPSRKRTSGLNEEQPPTKLRKVQNSSKMANALVIKNSATTIIASNKNNTELNEDEPTTTAKLLKVETSGRNSLVRDDSFLRSPTHFGQICPICLEQCTNSGTHRLVALKCGHLFGEGCIRTWMIRQKRCATCYQTAKSSDIRNIFAQGLPDPDPSQTLQVLQPQPVTSIEYPRIIRTRYPNRVRHTENNRLHSRNSTNSNVARERRRERHGR